MKRKDLEKIKTKVLPILRKADVTRAALFGSYVRGDNTPNSDIDILVELPRGKSLFDLVGLQIDLEKNLDKKVDVVSYRSICPHLKESIFSNQYTIL
jgi:predicted nucleotidyltransferase